MKNLVMILALAGFSWPLAAQHVNPGSIDQRGDRPRFSFFIGGGFAQMEGDESTFVLELEPRFELQRSERLLVDLALPLLWQPEPRPMPAAEGAVFPGDAGFGEPEIGSSLALVPSFELTPRTLRCCQFSFFAGAGAVFESGRRTELRLDGPIEPDRRTELRLDGPIEPDCHAEFRLAEYQPGRLLDASGAPVRAGTVVSVDEVAPVLTAGVSWSRRSSDRFEVRAKLRGLVKFYDERRIDSPLGEIVVPSTTSWGVMLTLGVRLKR